MGREDFSIHRAIFWLWKVDQLLGKRSLHTEMLLRLIDYFSQTHYSFHGLQKNAQKNMDLYQRNDYYGSGFSDQRVRWSGVF